MYISNFNILFVGPYFCSKSGCWWKNFTKDIDWGYYDESNGDCELCRIRCQGDKACKAFECGLSYCSWWAAGTCDSMGNDTMWNTAYETCRILGKQFIGFRIHITPTKRLCSKENNTHHVCRIKKF